MDIFELFSRLMFPEQWATLDKIRMETRQLERELDDIERRTNQRISKAVNH